MGALNPSLIDLVKANIGRTSYYEFENTGDVEADASSSGFIELMNLSDDASFNPQILDHFNFYFNETVKNLTEKNLSGSLNLWSSTELSNFLASENHSLVDPWFEWLSASTAQWEVHETVTDITTSPFPISSNIQLLEECNFSDETRRRIEYLAYLPEGWHGGEGHSLNPMSLRNYLNFWLDIKKDAIEPDLFLCPNGNIQAEWFKNSKRNLSIEFKRNEALLILIDGKNIRQINEENFENLAQELLQRPGFPLKWTSNV